MRTTLAVLAAAIFTLIAIGPAAGGRALASVRWTGNQGQLDRSVAYLQGAQNPDGGFGGVKGAASDPLFTAWVGLGLAAAGVNPQDQRAPGGGTDMYTYLTANVPGPDADTTDVERAALVAVAATGSAHDVGGHDLAAAILARQRPDGSFPHAAGGTAGGINDTAFAILPLSAESGLGDALARAATWLVGVQGADGGWSYAPGASESTDMTGAVLQALQAAPPASADADARTKAWSYLHAAQHADGGFGQTPSDGESNTASTAWVVQALWAAGEDPAGWRPSGRTPLDYLAAMQQADGSIRYKSSQSMNDLWMTAYALPAFAGWPWPIPAVARAVAPAPPPATAAPAPTGGVTSGGGGRGAPLFSRPQPGSKGRAGGGIQRVTASGSEAQKTTATLRAKNTKKVATGTAQSNGAAAHGVTPVRSAVRHAPRRHAAKPIRAPRDARAGGGGGSSEVTGRLLGGAAATGVSGAGKTPGVAPGLRTAATTADDARTTALVLAGLLALAALGGAAGEARSGRRELLP